MALIKTGDLFSGVQVYHYTCFNRFVVEAHIGDSWLPVNSSGSEPQLQKSYGIARAWIVDQKAYPCIPVLENSHRCVTERSDGTLGGNFVNMWFCLFVINSCWALLTGLMESFCKAAGFLKHSNQKYIKKDIKCRNRVIFLNSIS